MKFPTERTGITTPGAMSVAITVMAAGDFISSWWIIVSVILFFLAMGLESGSGKA